MIENLSPPNAEQASDPTARRVYAVWGGPPETQAYAMAKYSRSSQGMLESIADLAHLAVAFEHVSILAAIALVDEQLWDGQERSTRYQSFNRSRYHLPDSLV